MMTAKQVIYDCGDLDMEEPLKTEDYKKGWAAYYAGIDLCESTGSDWEDGWLDAYDNETSHGQDVDDENT